MPHFSCYLPESLIVRLDEHVRKTPGANRSGIMREALQQLLDGQPTTVKDVFREALTTPAYNRPDQTKLSRADAFHKATQR